MMAVLFFRKYVSVAALAMMAGCSSVPKPAVPDGSRRVLANDPARVQAFQERVSQDRALLTENNLLKAQVEILNSKLNEMVTIVREALVLPALPVVSSPAAPAAVAPQIVPGKSVPFSLGDFPSHTVKVTASGVVVRVFHPWARTEFEPSEAVAQAIRTSTRSAQSVEVRGMTDSPVVNHADRLIAMERAEKARNWLIQNGVDSSRIRTRYFTAGNFLTENSTAQGRALNRRVEIDARTL